jgi:hypothetical protein
LIDKVPAGGVRYSTDCLRSQEEGTPYTIVPTTGIRGNVSFFPDLALAAAYLGDVQDGTRLVLLKISCRRLFRAREGQLLQRLDTMHLAMPARKSSNPPPYATRSTRFPILRRSRVQAIVLCACAVGAVIFILSQILGGSSERIPLGTPPVVIVTVLDPDSYSKDYINNIKENRIEYAKKHGKRLWHNMKN